MTRPNPLSAALALALAALAALPLATSAAVDQVGDWNVTLPPKVFKSLSASERTCAQRALRSMEQGGYRAAASEWQRFETEFLTTASEPAAAWAAFFRAYCLYRAKDGYKAIELFSSAIETFPGEAGAGAALFFRGQAQAENGAVAKAVEDYRALVDDEATASHPLAYAARHRLGWRELEAGHIAEAEAEWAAAVALPRSGNARQWDETRVALDELRALADPAGALAEVAARPGKPSAKCDALKGLMSRIASDRDRWQGVARAYFEKRGGGEKGGRALARDVSRRLFAAYSTTGGPVFAEAGREWDFRFDLLGYRAAAEPETMTKAVEELAVALRKVADAEERNRLAADAVGRLGRLGRGKEAKILLDVIADPVKRAFAGADLGWSLRDGQMVADSLVAAEGDADPQVAERAKRSHAAACQQLLRDYDTAIRLFEEAPEPPGTLWRVAECHRAAGRGAKAQATLDEICAMFPDDAARAMLTKGDWYAGAGQKKEAIGCYRRVLSHAQWKKSPSASQAHQRLEAYGIATGGAVLNDAM